MRVLVPNLGSTSLKYQLIEMDGERVLARGKIERIGSSQAQIILWNTSGQASKKTADVPDHRAAVQILLEQLAGLEPGNRRTKIDAVGFKAVHGGPKYCGSFPVTNDLLNAMHEFIPVAPVHNPVYIQAMLIFRELLPDTPMVAVFEPGFHATIPEKAYVYGVPYEWAEEFGVRRYGFHGSSHRYVSQRAPQVLGRSPQGLRLVSCHLGGSSSLGAIVDGKSVDCSFGFSPQSGLVQGTRCGDLDPLVVPYVMNKEELSLTEVMDILRKQGGLIGISGFSADLRDLEEAADKGNRRAALAIEVLVYEVKKYLGAFAAAMGGLDAIAFAGGIGENSSRVRKAVCDGLGFLGVELDNEKNSAPASGDRLISATDSRVSVLIIYTNEEIIVARETARVLGS